MEVIEESPASGMAQVLRMSWPASLTMLNGTVLRFVDGLMVARVGPLPFAAQYVAGMTSFAPESFLMGLLTVVNTYVSQNLGANRHRQTGQYAWAGIAIALAAAVVLAPLALAARPMFTAFNSLTRDAAVNTELVNLEVVYYRYMILSIGLTLTMQVVQQFFFGVHRPRVVLAASIVGNVFNVGANAVLIYGLLGFPAMGLEGAAIGTVLSWAIQLAILLAVFLSPAVHAQFGTRSPRGTRWRHCAELFRLGWPAGVQLSNDIASWAAFSILLIGFFGQAALAATTAVMRYLGLSFMPAVGIGIATTALVGRHIGRGESHLARRSAHAALLAAMVYMGLCGLAFWVFRRPMIAFFVHVNPAGSPASAAQDQQLAEHIIDLGAKILLCAAVFQLFDAVGIVYAGALRGAGDTLWPMLITIALSWTVTLGGGYLAIRLLPALGSLGPWMAASIYVILMGVALAWRFESGAWRKIDLLGRHDAQPAA